MFKKVLSLLFVFCIVSAASAQVPFFKQVTVSGTGAQIRINALCQDSRLLIWIATSDGLYKYNGNGFDRVVFDDSLDSYEITAISALSNGGVAFGTKTGGLYRWKDDHLTAYSTGETNIGSSIGTIVPGKGNELWVATLGHGLMQLNGDKVKWYTVKDGLPDDYIYDIAIGDDGLIWVGSDGGLTSISPGASPKIRNYTTNEGLPDNIVRAVEPGVGGSIGVGTEEGGFCIFDSKKATFQSPPYFENWDKGSVTSLLKLENEFWIGTQKAGIIDYEFSSYKRTRLFSKDYGFDGTNVNCMLKDHEGNIWIGSGMELYLSLGEKIEFKKQIEGVNLDNIHSIIADRTGKVWFSNDNGVFSYDAFESFTNVTQPLLKTPFQKLNVISFYEDIYGFIWMGTFDKGVLRFDPKSGQGVIFDVAQGLTNSSVLSIDGSGSVVWLATLGGVSKCILLDSTLSGVGDFVSFSEENGLGNNFIYKVFVDSRHQVWFATDGKGLSCFKNGKFYNYSEREGLKSRVIYSITEDPYGMIWISSVSDGIYRFDGTSFRNFSIAQGLSEINVSALTTDQKGNLIVVHKKGIDIMDPSNYQVISFGNEMGISGIDPDVNAVHVDIQGNVWVGTQKGIIKLSLDKKVGEKKPVLLLNNILCFLEKVDTATVKAFGHDRNHISFDFIGLWYADPMKLSYQYKLQGYNNEWITTRDRFITFPNLRPGTYKFMLRASINGNFSDAQIITYSFKINFPIWQRGWFLILVTVVFIALLLWYIRNRDIRMKSIQAIQKEKIESQYEILKSQVNPHFLFNSFNTLITVIEDDKKVAVEYVNKLSDFFRSLLAYKDKDLITIKEELELVANYIFLQQKRYGSNFKVEIDLPGLVQERYLIPPLGIQILLENCLKHNSVSRETPLLVEIYQEDYKFLIVKNNINEKMIKDPSTGIGLQNLKNRYRLLNDSVIEVTTEDGIFIVKLPLIKS